MSSVPLVIGTPAARFLSDELEAEFSELTVGNFDRDWWGADLIEKWRDALIHGSPVADIVVAIWSPAPRPLAVVGQELDDWIATLEEPFALWFVALAAACERCADDGQVIGVIDRPDPKLAAGWGSQAAVADAVEVMARSLALIHKERNVRINTVTTAGRLTAASGQRARAEMLATVGMLLSQSTIGMNASAIHLGDDL